MQKNKVPQAAEKNEVPEKMKALCEKELSEVSGGLQTRPIIKKLPPEEELIHIDIG